MPSPTTLSLINAHHTYLSRSRRRLCATMASTSCASRRDRRPRNVHPTDAYGHATCDVIMGEYPWKKGRGRGIDWGVRRTSVCT